MLQRKTSFVLMLIALLVTACGGDSPSAPVEPTVASAPAEVAVPAEPVAGSGEPVSGLRTFVIVPEQSTVSYIADEEFFGDALGKYGIPVGKVDTIGRTQAIAGQLALNLDDLSSALGANHFTVQLNTLESDQSLRDGWLRDNGPRFDDYPEAMFVATAIEGAPDSYNDGDEVTFQLVGDLTIREITQPATFEVTARLAGDTLTGTATTRILMSDFGIDPPDFIGTLTVADEVGIEVAFTAVAQP